MIRIYQRLGHGIGQHVQEFRFELTPVHWISLLVARHRNLRSMLRGAPRTERSLEFLAEFLKLLGVHVAHGPEVKPLLGPASDIESPNGFDLCSTILRPSAGCDEGRWSTRRRLSNRLVRPDRSAFTPRSP
jgi:hypothetical protein